MAALFLFIHTKVQADRDDFQIWGWVSGYAAYTPPNLGTSTAIPKEPPPALSVFLGGYVRIVQLGQLVDLFAPELLMQTHFVL